MNYEFKLAVKYFRARRKSLARFTSIVAVASIAAGVASLIVAQALAHGFGDEMRDKILANTAHVSVLPANGAEISDWRQIKNALEKLENVTNVEPTAYGNAIITGETETSYAVLKVQDSKFNIQDLGLKNEDSRLSGAQIAVGARLAEKLHENRRFD